MSQAQVKLDHKTGPVVITIQAETPEVAAYMANRIKEIFGKTRASFGGGDDFLSGLFKNMGIKP